MIIRFRTIIPNVLYRGSAPSLEDVKSLKEELGINKIVSLDKHSGERINRVCQLLGIKHIKIYIDGTKKSLLHLLSQNFKEVFLENGPTFIHCLEGKDRTGLVSALIECKFLGKFPEKAIQEAKLLGFGIGVPNKVVHLYEKLIKTCKPNKDQNNADIVSNERTYIGDNRDGALDEGHRGSFAPYLEHTRQNPIDSVYQYIDDQSPTRENYHSTWKEKIIEDQETNTTPLVGIYDNGAGIHGVGPVEPVGGFISD